MTITQISPIRIKFLEALDPKIVFLIVLIFFIFSSGVYVRAQNVIIQVYDPLNPGLKLNSLAQLISQIPVNSLSQPIKSELEAYYSSPLYPGSQPILAKKIWFELPGPTDPGFNREVFRQLYNKPRVDEKAALRQEWEAVFGFDVWSPYYKYKEIESLVKKKFSVQVFKFKGAPLVEKGKIFYVFAATF